MNVKNSLTVLLLSSLFVGCGPKNIDVTTIEKPKPQLNIQDLSPLELRNVKWFIITPENYKTVFADLEKQKYSVVLFGLTDDDYQNLSINMAEIRKYIVEQKQIIKSYKDYYEPKIKE